MERIARVAFDAAMKRGKRLCSVEKSNVLEVGWAPFALPLCPAPLRLVLRPWRAPAARPPWPHPCLRRSRTAWPLPQVSQLWKDVVCRVAQDYPEVELSHM